MSPFCRFVIYSALATLAVCARTGSVLSQDEYSDPWRWATFNTDSGLPSNDILDLVETSRGATWAATRSGLAWFDEFRWHAIGESAGLPPGVATWLSPVGDGEVLVIVGFRLHRGNEKGFRQIPVRHQGENLVVEGAIELDPSRILLQGRLIGEDGVSLYEMGPQTLRRLPVSGKFAGHPYTRLWKTRAGTIFITTDQGFFRWSGSGWECLQRAATDLFQIRCPVENTLGQGLAQTLYPPELAGVWTWQAGDAMMKQPDLGAGPIHAMDINDDGEVAAVFRSGGMKVRRSGAWIDVPPAPVRTQTVTFVKYASNGDLWIGTQDGLVLCRLSATRWASWHTDSYDKRNVVNALLADRDGSVWLGTGEGIEHRKPNGEIIQSLDRIDGVNLSPITGLSQDDDGGVWACSGSGFNGAFRWNGADWKRFGAAEGLTADHVHRIVRDPDGTLWFLGVGSLRRESVDEGGGIFRFEKKRMERWGPGTELASSRVYAMVLAENGARWFGTLRGISRYHEGGWKHWTTDQGLHHPKAFCLARTADGRLWFGHRGSGVGYIDADERIHYEGLPANLERTLVMDLQVDADGALWVATNAGLFRYKSGEWIEFSRRSGLENSSLWPILALKERVLVGTDGSGTAILSNDPADEIAPRVELSQRSILRTTAWMQWKVHPYRGAMPATTMLTRFRRDNEAWSEWSTRREAELCELSSGEHRFSVQARGLFGDFDPKGSTLSFVLPAPIYLRPHVVMPVALLALTAVTLGLLLYARRRRHSIELRSSEQRLQAILDNTPAVVYVKALDGKYILINRRFEGLFHITREKIIGKTDYDVFPPEVAGAFRRNDLQVAQESSSLLIEEQAPHEDGMHTYISAKFPLRGPNGNPYAVCGISTDITARRLAEQAKELLESELRHAQKMEALGTLAGGVAHDFNNLLQAIFGYTELAKATLPSNHPGLISIDMVMQAAQQARGVVNALLTFTRKDVARKAPVNLGEVVRGSLRLLRRIIPAAIEIDDATQDVSDIWVFADDTQIQQVVVNLAVNARDAMPQGGRLRISLRNGPSDAAQLIIEDTGVGMTPEVQSRLFEPFFTTKPRGQGTGLGTSIIHGIVRNHNGTIDVHSEPGRGTKITITLPCCAPPPDHPRCPAPRPPMGHGEVVLVVEDNEHVRSIIVSTLRSRGYIVLAAADGAEALASLKDRTNAPCLLILDLDLPHRELLSELHHDNLAGNALPVLLITGSADFKPPWNPRPVDQVLHKPFQMNDLLEAVETSLAHRVAASGGVA